MMVVVLRCWLARSLWVSAGVALDVRGAGIGVLFTNCRPVGTLAMVWLVRGERQRQRSL